MQSEMNSGIKNNEKNENHITHTASKTEGNDAIQQGINNREYSSLYGGEEEMTLAGEDKCSEKSSEEKKKSCGKSRGGGSKGNPDSTGGSGTIGGTSGGRCSVASSIANVTNSTNNTSSSDRSRTNKGGSFAGDPSEMRKAPGYTGPVPGVNTPEMRFPGAEKRDDVSIPAFNPPVPNRAWTAMRRGLDIEQLSEEEKRDLYVGRDMIF